MAAPLERDPELLADWLAHRLATDRACVFLTGEAGTGKTHLTRLVLARLGPTALVTAYTGVAALQLDEETALTAHRALGLPVLTAGDPAALPRVVEHFQGVLLRSLRSGFAAEVRARLRERDVLVLDEVGMVPPDMLEHVDLALRIVRERPDAPFGGMGVLAVGDVLQLPPVRSPLGFVFRAPAWAAFDVVLLREVRRQTDAELAPLLAALRMGRPPMGAALTLGTVCEARAAHPALRTERPCLALMSRKDEVAQENDLRLRELQRQPHLRALLHPSATTPVPVEQRGHADVLDELAEAVASLLHCPRGARQTWVVGMRVMVVRNHRAESRGDTDDADGMPLVNGDTGTVAELATHPAHGDLLLPVVVPDRFPDRKAHLVPQQWRRAHCHAVHRDPQSHRPTGHTDACFSSLWAVPLIPAWAMTCHKAQGVTVPAATRVLVHAARHSAVGSLYVAASRVRQADQLVFVGGGWRQPAASGEARQYYAELLRRAAAAPDGTDPRAPLLLPGAAPTTPVPAGLAGPASLAALAASACVDPGRALPQARARFADLAGQAAAGGLDLALGEVVLPVLRELAARFPDAGRRPRRRPRAAGDAAGPSLLWRALVARARAEDKPGGATAASATIPNPKKKAPTPKATPAAKRRRTTTTRPTGAGPAPPPPTPPEPS